VEPAETAEPIKMAASDLAETPLDAGLGLAEDPGGQVVVMALQPDRPASRSGVRVGDVLLSLGGEPCTGLKQFRLAMSRVSAQATVEVGLLRGADELSRVLKDDQVKIGFALAPTDEGLEVVDIKDNCPASRAGFQVGDVLSSANGERCHDLPHFRRAVRTSLGSLEVEVQVAGNTGNVRRPCTRVIRLGA
jgi:S1-C subfamily serine protease